jgi:hypothetical protein
VSAVNPILVVKNNVGDYMDALHKERDALVARIEKIDADIETCYRLSKVVETST